MSNESFRKSLKFNVEPSYIEIKNEIQNMNVKKAYEKYEELRKDEVFEKRVDNAFLQMLNLFDKNYKGVSLDCPIGRLKSKKSVKEKLEKMEIERLCKKYAIDDLSKDEANQLYSLIAGKAEKEHINKKIKRIMLEKVDNLKLVDSVMQEKNLNGIVKTAIARIARIKVEKEETDPIKKQQLIDRLEVNYGDIAAKKTGNFIMLWGSVQKAIDAKRRMDEKNPTDEDIELLEKIADPEEYLKLKDIRGLRIIIAAVSDDIETDNAYLKGVIERRKKAPEADARRYSDESCIEIEKNFSEFLEQNDELLEKLDLKLVARKEKEKQNGYLADHLKFGFLDNEDYCFELQIRSLYRDDMARGNGPAGHSNRDGKERIPLDVKNKMKLAKQIDENIPEFKGYPKDTEQGYKKIIAYKTIQNIAAYYPEWDINSKEFREVYEFINSRNIPNNNSEINKSGEER